LKLKEEYAMATWSKAPLNVYVAMLEI